MFSGLLCVTSHRHLQSGQFGSVALWMQLPVIDLYDLWAFHRMGDIVDDEPHFYSNAEDYWREVTPTVDGMLGGYGSISSIDINGSKAFLQKFLGVINTFNCP